MESLIKDENYPPLPPPPAYSSFPGRLVSDHCHKHTRPHSLTSHEDVLLADPGRGPPADVDLAGDQVPPHVRPRHVAPGHRGGVHDPRLHPTRAIILVIFSGQEEPQSLRPVLAGVLVGGVEAAVDVEGVGAGLNVDVAAGEDHPYGGDDPGDARVVKVVLLRLCGGGSRQEEKRQAQRSRRHLVAVPNMLAAMADDWCIWLLPWLQSLYMCWAPLAGLRAP